MRIFITVLVLIFSLQSFTKADDIRDFEIEGMSIGDSLLDYYNKKKIENSKRNYFKNQRKYYVVGISNNLENYEVVDIYLKTGDSNYIIRTIAGLITTNLKDCLAKKKEITKEFDKMFGNLLPNDVVKPHEFDISGKSKQYQRVYFFGNGEKNDNHIRIECDNWTKEIKDKHKFTDGLSIVAMTTEILDWIYSDYK